jgi:iron complex outermembrane recepter protein
MSKRSKVRASAAAHSSFPQPTIMAHSVRYAIGMTALALLPHAAYAAESPAPTVAAAPVEKVQRVEVTGSSIKRLDLEASLPVQVITREEIDRLGVTTAEQLLSQVSAAVGSIEEKAQNTDTQKDSGFSGANLRGLGVSSTLVLLNGRRMANYAFGGKGVDLGSIPMAALERVEILKDGASATYGADAVGGVINFITRKDYQGAQISARAGGYGDGGGNRKEVTLGGGFGDIDRDRFNVFGSLQYQKNAQLKANQREWSKTALRPDVGSVGTSTTNWPANLFPTTSASPIYGSVSTNDGKCAPPSSVLSGGVCQFDYQATADLVPETTKSNAFGRAVFAINAKNRVFAEAAYAKNEAYYRISPATFTSYRMTPTGSKIALYYPKGGSFFPKTYIDAKTGLPTALDQKKNVYVSVRLLPLGQRERVQDTDQERYLVGAEGEIAGWDYSAALNHSVSNTKEQYNKGFIYGNKLGPLITSGVVNLWGDNTPEVQAQMEATQANMIAGRTGKAVSNSVDAHASKDVYQLPAGAVAFALGFEVRREKLTDTQSAEARSGLLLNVTSSPDTFASRNVKALYSEIHVPVIKTLDLDFTVRHDSYDSDNIGSSTNPKLALRWQPVPALVVRGSAGTGFRAPSLADVSASGSLSSSSNFHKDQARCINNVGPGCVAAAMPIRSGGNPFLKPETSKQFAIGAAISPGLNINASLDYWVIKKENVISQLSETLIDSNFAYISKFITRDPADPAFPGLPGKIDNILLPVDNQGARNVNGIDLAIQQRLSTANYGKFTTSLNGTLLTKSEEQLTKGGAYVQNLARYANLYPTPRWKHNLSLTWSKKDWSVSVTNKFQTGYLDAFASTVDPKTGFVNSVPQGTPGSHANEVPSYSTFDLQTGYSGFKNTRLRAGVINLMNKAPNVSNQGGYFRGFDQAVDATGRYAYVSASYSL